MISPANALKFSMWLAATHPQAFARVFNTLHTSSGSQPRPAAMRNESRPQRAGLKGFADGLETVTVEPLAVDEINTNFDASAFSDPNLEEIGFSADALNLQPLNLPAAADSVDTSGGFWSSLGSGLSSMGSGVASAVGSVARALTSPPVLASAGQIASAVIQGNTQTRQAQLQQQSVLQSQVQRTLSGAGPAPVQYAVNPATGLTQPYYYDPGTGQYQLTAPGNAFTYRTLAPYLPYLLIGGGVILIIAMARNA